MNTSNDPGDQRNLLLAVVLSGLVLLLWQVIFPPPPPVEQPPPEAPTASDTKESPAPKAGEPAAPDASGATAAPAPAFERKPLDVSLDAPGRMHIEFSNDGQIASWSLTEAQYQDTLADGSTRPFRFVAPVGELLALLEGLGPDDEAPKGVFEPPQVGVMLGGRATVGEHAVAEKTDDRLSLRWKDPTSGVEVTRTYRLDPSGYTLSVDVELENPGAAAVPYDLELLFQGVQNDDEASGSMFMPPVYLYETVCKFGDDDFERFPATTIVDRLEDDDPVRFDQKVRWAGVDNRYFMTALLAEPGSIESCAAATDREGLPARFTRLRQAVEMTGGEIAGGQSVKRTFQLYAGPKKLSDLEATSPPMAEAIDFGWFAAICVPMLWLMRVFFGFVENWGVAIILLTIVVKLITLPLTLKQYKSMAAMKKIQPAMKALQEKHANDKVRLQQEMMKLYKEHQVNPLAGCLPMILMMPIYFSLYRTIYSAVELYRADFALWLTDLSIQDPLYITPVLLGVLMLIQMRLNPSAGDQTQQKIIMYVMPIMFTGMMLFLPSGLVLYILVNTVLGICQQTYMLKKQADVPVPTKARAKA